MRRLVLVLAAALAACAAPRSVAPLADARIVSDFDTYSIRRVGLLPAVGVPLSARQADDLQAAFFAELSAATDYEIVRLGAADLEAIPRMEPHRTGRYRPQTILAVSKRYALDALFVPTVTDLQPHPPQRLGVQVDLVSAETGQTLWASSVQLDAAQEHVRRSIEAWARRHQGDVSDSTWELTLLSPRRFARFAAYQVAALI